MDDSSWLTPSIADILDQGAAPPGGDGSIRGQMLSLQKELGNLGTPARIINVRPQPAYTLYIARPDTVGRLGNRRTITPAELRRSLGKIAESHKDWTLGFLPQLRETPESVGILVRTGEHQVLSLRRLLVRSTFRNHPSTLAFTVGNTLEQQLIVRDLARVGHVLITGKDRAKQHVVRGLLLTLILLNTPGELRLAMGGQSSESYKPLVNTPHALGRLLTAPEDGQRLLDGLVKEIQRRQQWFQDEDAETIEIHNAILKEQGKTPLPSITLLLDSLSDEEWMATNERWLPALETLLTEGRDAGIYLILSADQPEDVPDSIQEIVSTQIVMRSAASVISERLENFHGSLLRFVDAFVVDQDDAENGVTPVELCAISNEEIYRAVTYWRQAAKQRYQEAQLKRVSGKTGVTGILRATEETQDEPPAPPVPPKPSSDTLMKATQALAIPLTEEETPEEKVGRAQAMAAYLGWIGVGPLQDVMGMSYGEAQDMLVTLQEMGIVEPTEAPTPRFMRLKHNPYEETEEVD